MGVKMSILPLNISIWQHQRRQLHGQKIPHLDPQEEVHPLQWELLQRQGKNQGLEMGQDLGQRLGQQDPQRRLHPKSIL